MSEYKSSLKVANANKHRLGLSMLDVRGEPIPCVTMLNNDGMTWTVQSKTALSIVQVNTFSETVSKVTLNKTETVFLKMSLKK